MREEMTTELKTKLRAALMLASPNIGKDYFYDRCVTKYVNAMLPAISKAISLNHKSKLMLDEFSFAQAKIREEIGTIGKPQKYIYELMKSSSTTSLILVIRNGFSKNGVSKLSTVKLNPIYKELIMDELLNLRVETNLQLLDEIEADANYTVNVDPVSLASFIAKTAATIKTTTNGDAYKEKLLRNLAAARQLQTMVHDADATNASPYIRERWKMDDCGRIYGQGYSLQRMTKEVRHAALGVCHKYDFKASAFAIMAGLAHEINPALLLGATLDYVKNRQIIRKRIAEQLNISESLVKTIFTALGFGAELKNNQHNAIRGALAEAARMQHDTTKRLERDVYNNLGADEFRRLVENRTFGYIYEELQLINKTIIDHFKTNELVIDGNIYNEINMKTGKKRTDKQKLAWIYQAYESMAMQQFYELAKQEPLLTTHDCIYLKRKLNANEIVDITYQLQQTFPYLRFEHEEIIPISTDTEYGRRCEAVIADENAHKEFIRQEEANAVGYISPFLQQHKGEIYSAHNWTRELHLANAKTTHSTFSSVFEGVSS